MHGMQTRCQIKGTTILEESRRDWKHGRSNRIPTHRGLPSLLSLIFSNDFSNCPHFHYSQLYPLLTAQSFLPALLQTSIPRVIMMCTYQHTYLTETKIRHQRWVAQRPSDQKSGIDASIREFCSVIRHSETYLAASDCNSCELVGTGTTELIIQNLLTYLSTQPSTYCNQHSGDRQREGGSLEMTVCVPKVKKVSCSCSEPSNLHMLRQY